MFTHCISVVAFAESYRPYTKKKDLLLMEENPMCSPCELSDNFQTNNGGAPLWRNGMAVFWYGKHGHWLRGVNTSTTEVGVVLHSIPKVCCDCMTSGDPCFWWCACTCICACVIWKTTLGHTSWIFVSLNLPNIRDKMSKNYFLNNELVLYRVLF